MRALAAQICVLAVLCSSLYLVLIRGIGACYFQKASPDAIRTAIDWDPANPQYYDTLGTFVHLYADDAGAETIVHLYQRATQLSPRNAQFWSDLGAGYDWAGRPNDAFTAFQRALQLFPNSPEINWRLANFCIRNGNMPEGLHALHTVLLANSPPRRDVFVVAASATRDETAILEMLPPRAPILFDYLYFRTQRGELADAEETWARILRLNLPFSLREALPYLDSLIQHKELRRLSEAWSILARKFPEQIERLHRDSNLIGNGNFEFDILNGGFDWRVVPTEGASVRLDFTDKFEGPRALQISFDGSRNLYYGHVFQYILVQPNSRYKFSADMKVEGITTDSGPRFQLSDAYNLGETLVSTENLVGSSGWFTQKAELTTKPETHLLLLTVARPMSTMLDNRFYGNVWITRVSLVAAP